MLLIAIDRLGEGGRSRRIHSSVSSVKIVLIVELKIQSQAVIVVVHGGGRATDRGKG